MPCCMGLPTDLPACEEGAPPLPPGTMEGAVDLLLE